MFARVIVAVLARVENIREGPQGGVGDLGVDGGFDIGPWAARVRLVDAAHTGAWELPVLGVVPAPTAVLIRPDGHAAWVGDPPTRDSPTR